MHLDGALVRAESRPRKQRETEIDGGRVERVQALIQVHADRIVRIQRPGDANEDMSEIGEDAPVVRLVRVGQIGAGHSPPKSHVIKLAADRTQARLNVSQAFTVGQLGKSHCQILVQARESSMPRIALIAVNTFPELI